MFTCRQYCVVQVLDISSSAGSSPSLPLNACVARLGDAVDPLACTVIVHDHNTAAPPVEGLSDAWSVKLKAVIDASCTLDRVFDGLCSVCTASAAAAGQCPPGTHTFFTDVVGPDGLMSNTSVAVVLHVGALLAAAEVVVQFEVLVDTGSRDPGALEASGRMQAMLSSSQVLSQ
jgi:hypothetical protein